MLYSCNTHMATVGVKGLNESHVTLLAGARWLQVILTRETVGYDVTQLIADIGGQLGIWIGLSFVAIVELLELAWKVVNRAAVVRLEARRQRRRRRCRSVAESASSAVDDPIHVPVASV